MKKFYPFIPIIGIPLTFISSVDETKLDQFKVSITSAIIQGISINVILKVLTHATN